MDASTAAEALIEAGRRLDAQGYCPATSGNYSVRLDAANLLVTASGRHKGRLGPEDFVVVDYDGRPRPNGPAPSVPERPPTGPSAETPLHALMFRLDPSIGSVIHTHSVACTVLGLQLAGVPSLELAGYEMLKALPEVTTHERVVSLPIFENSQDIRALALRVQERWQATPFSGYVLRGHGLYAWGQNVDAALRAAEGLEFLMACELEKRKVAR
jgi:methylthioribulose-1-phosphate dehydratase